MTDAPEASFTPLLAHQEAYTLLYQRYVRLEAELSSLDTLVVVRLVVVPLLPRSPRRRWRVGRFGLIFCWT